MGVEKYENKENKNLLVPPNEETKWEELINLLAILIKNHADKKRRE